MLNSIMTSENILFFALTLGCLILGFKRGNPRWNNISSAMPGTAISLGILGTFYGIFMGLLDFDVKNIEGSIPTLLNGMKTAFATSLCGMTVAIILKIIFAAIDDRAENSTNDPLVSLEKIERAILSCFKSDEEYSLVSQVKLIRQELIDGRRETKIAFEEFTKHFSKMASESLVHELNKVVEKFNALLNDLVAESFKELKDSTIRLTSWQENYKDTIEKNEGMLAASIHHMEELQHSYSEILTRLSTLNENLDKIDKSIEAISISGTELDEHTKSLAAQNTLLESSIAAIKDIGREAALVVPEISEKLHIITSDISALQQRSTDFVSEATHALTENAKQIQQSTEDHLQSIETALEAELTKSLNSLAGALASLSGKFASDYMPLTEKLRDILRIAETANAYQK